jgi:DNA-binding response OmpR family regulator
MSSLPLKQSDTVNAAATLTHDFVTLAMALRRLATTEPDAATAAALASAAAQVTAANARLAADLAQLAREPHDRALLTAELSPLIVGDLHVDRHAQLARLNGRMLELTTKEYALLSVLASDPDRLFTKNELYRTVWAADLTAQRTRTLDSHLSRLRLKLGGAPWLENVYSVGYRLRPAAPNLAKVSR